MSIVPTTSARRTEAGTLLRKDSADLDTFREIVNHLAQEGKTDTELTDTFVKSGGGASPGKNSIRITC